MRTISEGFQSVSTFYRVSKHCFKYLKNKSALVTGIYVNWGFLHETGDSLDFDYLESRQKWWYRYIHTYIHPNIWNKAGVDAGNPGWSYTRPKLVCCKAWWLCSNCICYLRSICHIYGVHFTAMFVISNTIYNIESQYSIWLTDEKYYFQEHLGPIWNPSLPFPFLCRRIVSPLAKL